MKKKDDSRDIQKDDISNRAFIRICLGMLFLSVAAIFIGTEFLSNSFFVYIGLSALILGVYSEIYFHFCQIKQNQEEILTKIRKNRRILQKGSTARLIFKKIKRDNGAAESFKF